MMKVAVCTFCCAGLFAADVKKPVITAPPANEQLTYAINWPTGLSLGEARLSTIKEKSEAGEKWSTEFALDASVPGFPVMERAKSSSDTEFCSAELEKTYTHGKRKAE